MKLNFLKFAFFFIGASMLFVSCDPDLLDPTDEGDPTISVTGAPSAAIDAESSFTIKAVATPTATNPLKTLDITQDNQLVNFSRIKINGAAATANPILLFGNDKNGLSWDITIVAHSDASIKEYSVNIKDDGNNSANFSFDVSTSINNPSLEVTASTDISVAPKSLIGIMVKLKKGTFDLATLGVYQNDALITNLTRLYYDGLSATFDANPYLIPAIHKDGADITLYVRVQDLPSTDPYKFVLSDTEGNSATFDFNVTTATPVTELTGILLNAAGPVNTGGLDLDEGIGTGSANAIAEIRDEGIDLGLPLASNWKKSIAGVNGSVLRQLKPGQNGLSETFTYADVTAKETISSIYENGEAFTLKNDAGDLISASVNVGDLFVVKNGENFYLLIVKEVNVVTDSNADNYVFNIKK